MSPGPPVRYAALRPALGRAKRLPAAGPGSWLAFALTAVFVAGCASVVPASPAPSPTATGGPAAASTGVTAGSALLLVADPGGDSTSLFLLRLSGDIVTLPLPAPSVAAVVPGSGGRLVAVLADGRAFVAPAGAAGLSAHDEWRPIELSGSGRMPSGALIWSATSSPDGKQVAAIARPRDAQSPSALVVIQADLGRREVVPLADESEGVPPAWVDGTHVVIVQRDHLDRLFLALVEVATGRVTDRLALRAMDVAASADASTLALVTDGRIAVGPAAAVLSLGRAPDLGPVLPPGDLMRGGIALDQDGGSLAVAVDAGDPGSSRIAVYARDGDAWRAGARIRPPVSASGGWLTWLR